MGLLEKAIYAGYVKTFTSFRFVPPTHRSNSSSGPYSGIKCQVMARLMMQFVHVSRTPYNPLGPEGILMNSIGLLIAALAGLVVFFATRSHYKRQPLPEDELLLADQLAE